MLLRAAVLATIYACGASWILPDSVCVSCTERPGYGRNKLPVLKTAPRLPGTREWKPTASWAASSGSKRGSSKDAFFGTTSWMSDPYSRKWDSESAHRKMIESKVLYGNFKPGSGFKSLRTHNSKVTRQSVVSSAAPAGFWAGTPKGN